MDEEQKLYPQLIYRINEALTEVKESCGLEEERLIAPSVFDPYTRTFSWLAVAKERWSFLEEEHQLIRTHIKNEEKEKWENFLKEYKRIEEIKRIKESFQVVTSFLNDTNSRVDFHFALLALYEAYPLNINKYVDGIFFRNLKKRIAKNPKKQIAYAIAELLDEQEETYVLYPWLHITFYDNENNPEEVQAPQENNYPKYPPKNEADDPDLSKEKDIPKIYEQTYEPDHFYFNFLVPIFANYQDFKMDCFFNLYENRHILKNFKYLFIVPLYDAHIGGRGYGNLSGILQFPFKNKNDRDNFRDKNRETLLNQTHALVSRIKEAAIFEFLEQGIKERDDLIDHFIRWLPLVQDWESVMRLETVNSGKSAQLKYCYRRCSTEKDTGENWASCKQAEGPCSRCLDFPRIWSSIQDSIQDRLIGHFEYDKRRFHICSFKYLFSQKFIPEIGSRDVKKYENVVLIYEYPPYTIFPDDEERNDRLGSFYLRQQIDLLRQLILKENTRQETIRHGTNAAVAAIISRNHSHHIGSHVVPRSSIKKIRTKVEKLCSADKNQVMDQRRLEILDTLKGRLDEYVQKKADFVAEIATEPLTTTKDVRFFDEVILSFVNNVLLMDNIGANEGVQYIDCCNNRLKIFFTVNGQNLSAEYKATTCKMRYNHQSYPYSTACQCSLECLNELQRDGIDPPKDVTISVPGSLGEFAFFAFLENFIRNGIKHNKQSLDSEPGKDFEVHIELEELDNSDKDEFYKVKVYDNFTNPDKKVYVRDKDGNGNRVPLPKYLQSCIEKSIINNDGSLRKESWGIAEMKIMATLLRGSSKFSDVKGNLRVNSITKERVKRLAYEFYVMKPKNVAIISDKANLKHEETQKSHGIWWFDSLKEYENHVNDGNSPASFKFLIIGKVSEEDKEKLEEIKKCLPFRVLVEKSLGTSLEGAIHFNIIEQAIIDKFKNDDGSNVLILTWQAWMTRFIPQKCNDKKPHLIIFFQQGLEEEPTSSWARKNQRLIKDLKLSIITRAEEILGSQIDNDSFLLVYDRHSLGANVIKNAKRSEQIKFHEGFDKNSSDFIHLFAPPDESFEKAYELVEASLLKILVLDERITEVAHDRKSQEEDEKIIVAEKSGILICTHIGIDGVTKALHPSIDETFPSICAQFKTNSGKLIASEIFRHKDTNDCTTISFKDIDILVIHQGILEIFFKDWLKDTEDYNQFLGEVQRTVPYVVIDTGRGIPARLPDAAKFLPFSLLEEFLMKDQVAKYSLTKNVMSLIRRKKLHV